jgi:hypothetical protein
MLTAVKYVLPAISACLLGLYSLGQAVDLEELKNDRGYVFFNGRAEKLANSTIITLDSVLKPASQDRFEALPDKTVILVSVLRQECRQCGQTGHSALRRERCKVC